MTLAITSIANPRVKQALRLRDRKGRAEQGRFLIDGARELGVAVRHGVSIDELFICPEQIRDEETRKAVRDAKHVARRQGSQVYEVTPQVLERIGYGDREGAIICVARTWSLELGRFAFLDNPHVLVLENVEKPGNLGAVLRTCDAASVATLFVSGEGADPFNPNVVRASMGALFTVPIVVADSDATLRWLVDNEFNIFAARVDGAALYTEVDYRSPCAIVLGSESQGLSETFRGPECKGIRLPMQGEIDSLNVSVSAGIICYEALRQRSGGPLA
jgi:RNA methyltransferase, TrmH family